jgi:hypothetical protein
MNSNWSGFDWWRAFLEQSNEFSGSIKRGEFIDHMSTCQILKKYSAA